MIWENLKMAMISIGNAKLRSFLTMLGIIIGVAAVISIVAIGQGVKASVASTVSDLGSNVLTITSGQTNLGKGSKGGPNIAASIGSSTLTQADIAAIRKAPHIKHVAALSLISGVLLRGNVVASDALVAATTPDYQAIREQKFARGRFLTEADDSQPVIVIGSTIKDELFPDSEAVGQMVSFRGRQLKVIGVVAKNDAGVSLGPSNDAIVYLPISTATEITGSTPQIMRILAQVDSAERVDTSVDIIKNRLKSSHGGQEDFTVATQADLLGTFDTILTLLTTFIGAIASISLLVGGIGIMNIMLVSVTERTREIGIRKAIGASSMTVLGQFMIEAVVLSLLGGAVGVGVAYLLANIVGKLAKISPIFTWQSIALAVGISAGVGVIFGIAPAIKAARKRPIDALRYE